MRKLKEEPETAVWDLKLLVNRWKEDDDDEKKIGDNQSDSDDELDEAQQDLLDLVRRVVPSFKSRIDNKKFKKRGLRHLVELE